MNILFISSYYLFSETRFGGSKRLYLLAKELEKHAKVSVICLDGCKELDSGVSSFKSHPDFKHFLYLPWTDSRGFFKKFFFPGIIIEDMLKANHGLLSSFIGNKTYDAAFLAYSLGLSFIGTVVPPGQFPVVYSEDDLFLEKVRSEKQKGIFGPIYRAVRMKQLTAFYRRKLASCDTVTAISSQEKEIFNRYFPSAHVELLGYGIDLERYPFLATAPDIFTLGFIGNFLHRPNTDGLAWFLETVYPEIKNATPGIRMVIAGHSIPDDLREKHGKDNSIAWKGDVADLKDFYREISVLVNPIISGRGMRTKLIEAGAYGRPIVSTTLGAEGAEDLVIDIADTANDFTGRCRHLMDDKSHYASAAKKNRSIVEQKYSASVVGKRLYSILSSTPGHR
jgi:glycosyltransferase involved in cell wall biosynthesis